MLPPAPKFVLAVHANVAVGLVEVALAHGKHLAQVVLLTALTHYFVLEHRCAGETPAGAALVLVLYRGGGNHFDVGEYKLHGIGSHRVGGHAVGHGKLMAQGFHVDVVDGVGRSRGGSGKQSYMQFLHNLYIIV